MNKLPYISKASDLGIALTLAATPAEARTLLGVSSGGGEGGAVDSVNGQTGDVTLDAADVGAAPAGAPLSSFENDVGFLTDADIPGSPVISVNNKTGVVVLTATDVGAATTAQGQKADTALQPGDLPAQSVSSVNDKTGAVVLSASDVGAATTAQGAKADSAVQPAALSPVATSGQYSDLSGTPATVVHTQGVRASRPTSASVNSTYYATDVRETYRWNGTAWVLISGGGVLLASVAMEHSGIPGSPNEIAVNGTDFNNPSYLPNAPTLLFTCGERPFIVTLSGTMRNGAANETTCVQLEVNGTVYTQLLDKDTIVQNWKAVVRSTKPLTFPAGTQITCRIKGVRGGTVDGAIFTNPVDPLQIVAVSV